MMPFDWDNAMRGFVGMQPLESADSLLARPPRNMSSGPTPRLPQEMSPEMPISPDTSMQDPRLVGSPTAALTLASPGSSMPRLQDSYENPQGNPVAELSPYQKAYNERVQTMLGGRSKVPASEAARIRAQAGSQAEQEGGINLQKLQQTGTLGGQKLDVQRQGIETRAKTASEHEEAATERSTNKIEESGRQTDARNQIRQGALDLARQSQAFFQTAQGREAALKSIEASHAMSAQDRGLTGAERRNELEALNTGLNAAIAQGKAASYVDMISTLYNSGGAQNPLSKAISGVPKPAYGVGGGSSHDFGADVVNLPQLQPTVGPGVSQLQPPDAGQGGAPAGGVPLMMPPGGGPVDQGGHAQPQPIGGTNEAQIAGRLGYNVGDLKFRKLMRDYHSGVQVARDIVEGRYVRRGP